MSSVMTNIPKKILQIAIGNNYVSYIQLQKIKTQILSLNSSYEYFILNDNDCITFLANNFPNFINTYFTINKPQHKSDLIRYLWLYKHGGIYIDIDLLFLCPFDYLLNVTNNPDCFFEIGAHHQGKLELANGVIGTYINNPIFLELANQIRFNPNPVDYGQNVKDIYYLVKTLCKKSYLSSFETELIYNKKTYFLQERQIEDKYYTFINNNDIIALSNGHMKISI